MKDSIKLLREQAGMTQTALAAYFEIPRRTVQNWDLGLRECPQYLLKLMRYKMEKEGLIRADMAKGSQDGETL